MASANVLEATPREDFLAPRLVTIDTRIDLEQILPMLDATKLTLIRMQPQ